jgi:hypothetical protein
MITFTSKSVSFVEHTSLNIFIHRFLLNRHGNRKGQMKVGLEAGTAHRDSTCQNNENLISLRFSRECESLLYETHDLGTIQKKFGRGVVTCISHKGISKREQP